MTTRAKAIPVDTTAEVDSDPTWQSLYRTGGAAAVVILMLMAVQIVIFVIWPPPTEVVDWFQRFQENWLLGLVSFDVLYLLTNALLIPLYLAIYAALKRVSESAMLLATTLGIAGVVAYFASNTAFEMLAMSNQYAAAMTEVEQTIALAAGRALLAIYTGTAFDVYYILNGIYLLIVSVVMLRSSVFSKATAYWCLLSGILMSIPSTAGAIGPYFALASLVPWTVFSILVARRLLQLGRSPVSS